jgi:hypothetical protein
VANKFLNPSSSAAKEPNALCTVLSDEYADVSDIEQFSGIYKKG